jgi:hypothetical protein
MVLRCTKKLLAVIGPVDFTDPTRPDGRKCLLLTHAGTLFTIFDANVRASDFREAASVVSNLTRRELINEGLPVDVFGELSPSELIVAKMSDRSVLGCMNDMAFYGSSCIDHQGGLEYTSLRDLNRSLRRNINSARNYERPIDLTRNRLSTGS